MKKIATMFLVLFSFSASYAWDYSYNYKTGTYYKTGNSSFYRGDNERGNEVIDKDNSSEFLSDDGNTVDLAPDFNISSRTSTTDMLASGTSGAVQNVKFYTHEMKLAKQVNDKFELYGGTVLGASPYVLNNVGGIYDANDRVGAFASTRGGARYHATDDLRLVLESQYNLTGQLAENTGMVDGFNGAQYKGSSLVKTGFEFTF